MRNRILIILLFIVGLSLPAAAQTSSALEVSVGGGWSTLGYKVVPTQADIKGSNSGSWGLQAHVGYAFFFTPHIGLGIGVDFSHYGANASLSGTARWNDVMDAEGESYNHLALIHSLRDQQDVFMVDIPLTFYFVYLITDDLGFNLEVGARYGIPVLSKASYRADIEHQGDYGIWGLNLHDVSGHGFYREPDFRNTYPIAVRNRIAGFLKLGLTYEINRNVQFFGNIYGDYSFTNVLQGGFSELGFLNDRAGMEDTHSFMTDYNGIIATDNISDKSHPIQIGVEVGIRFIFPHKQSYPCMCYSY